jgi:hypothetical protein
LYFSPNRNLKVPLLTLETPPLTHHRLYLIPSYYTKDSKNNFNLFFDSNINFFDAAYYTPPLTLTLTLLTLATSFPNPSQTIHLSTSYQINDSKNNFNLFIDSDIRSFEAAYDIRTQSGAPKASPDTNATYIYINIYP